MAAAILHVEDDVALTELVALSLEALGFRGTTVTAETVEQGEEILDDAARTGKRLDLILSDMHLPDGTGLDLVRHVRASATWRTTPMLILSSDLNPNNVGRAYALGANAYVSKSPRGRSLHDVITALYKHWMTDVVTAPPGVPGFIDAALARAIQIRLRHAQLYQRLAEKFTDNRSESAFWLSRALVESNLMNVLGFVRTQHVTQDVDPGDADEVVTMQDATELALRDLESELEGNAMSRDDVYLRVLQLVSIQDIDLVARSMGRLFPVIPVAIETVRDILIASIQDVSAWIDLHASARPLRQQAAELRDAAMTLRAREQLELTTSPRVSRSR
jgi:two-component system, chemotaxis family, chemotaxis protein CheY